MFHDKLVIKFVLGWLARGRCWLLTPGSLLFAQPISVLCSPHRSSSMGSRFSRIDPIPTAPFPWPVIGFLFAWDAFLWSMRRANEGRGAFKGFLVLENKLSKIKNNFVVWTMSRLEMLPPPRPHERVQPKVKADTLGREWWGRTWGNQTRDNGIRH